MKMNSRKVLLLGLIFIPLSVFGFNKCGMTMASLSHFWINHEHHVIIFSIVLVVGTIFAFQARYIRDKIDECKWEKYRNKIKRENEVSLKHEADLVYVDLGLPSGLLWATCNVGADSPEKGGLYFAWGETTGFTAEQVKAGERKFLRSTYKGKKIKKDIKLEQDAAHVHVGVKWRMPTEDEWQELIDNCISEWTINYNETGVNGWTFTSKINGGSVFLPAAGYCYDSLVVNVGLYGRYWSSTCYDKEYVSLFASHPWNIDENDGEQWLGFSVRVVCER